MFVFVLFLVLIFVFAKPDTRRTRMVIGANSTAPSRRRASPRALSKAKVKQATRRPVRDRWTYEPVAELGTSLIAITHIHSPKVPIVTEAVILNTRMDGDSSDSDIEDDCLCYDWDLVHGKCIGRCKLPNYGLRFFTGVANFHFCTTWVKQFLRDNRHQRKRNVVRLWYYCRNRVTLPSRSISFIRILIRVS